MVAERKSFGELGKVRRAGVPWLTVLSEATIRIELKDGSLMSSCECAYVGVPHTTLYTSPTGLFFLLCVSDL